MALPTKNYEIKVQSLEYLAIKVTANKDGSVYDPTDDDVKIALPVINEDPITGDWKSANWQTIDSEHFARLLIGPAGDITLERGDYDILVKIIDDPEIPVLRAGRLSII